jgi:type I restriction enzyme S subunit
VGVLPAAWDVAPLGTLIGPLEAGVSVNSVAKEKDVFSHDECVLKTSCVVGGRFFPEEYKKIVPRDVQRAKLNPRKGCIIISRANTLELVGECGYVERDYPMLFLSDKLWMTRSERAARV